MSFLTQSWHKDRVAGLNPAKTTLLSPAWLIRLGEEPLKSGAAQTASQPYLTRQAPCTNVKRASAAQLWPVVL